MVLQVHIQKQNKITNLAYNIIQDWYIKVQYQIQQSGTKKIIPSYSILLTNKQHALTQQQQNKYHLVIVLQNQSLSPAHLLSLAGVVITFGQYQKQFIPAHVAQLTIANSIAIVVMQYYFQLVKQKANQQVNINTSVNRQINKNKAYLHRLNCIDCIKYYGSFNVSAKQFGLITNKRGHNILDGGAPHYAIYPTKQGLLAVGNLQHKFYVQMIDQLGLTQQDKQFCLDNFTDIQEFPNIRKILAKKFVEKTAEQWENIMKKRDTCVTAVRDFEQIHEKYLHPYLIKPKL